MSHRIDITIDEKGHATFHIRGHKGEKCLDIAKDFESVMGKAEKKRKTSEFYEKPEKEKVRI